MKYFLDTEFIERPGSIQLVSIGIVDENERTFYAENSSFDEREADDWVKANVLSKLRWWAVAGGPDARKPFARMKGNTIPGRSVEMFCTISAIKVALLDYFRDESSPEFWGYFADYDWVIFCWIFGKMIDLPKVFPKYCNDIKQLMVEHGIKTKVEQLPGTEHNALEDALWNKRQYEVINEVAEWKRGFKTSDK